MTHFKKFYFTLGGMSRYDLINQKCIPVIIENLFLKRSYLGFFEILSNLVIKLNFIVMIQNLFHNLFT